LIGALPWRARYFLQASLLNFQILPWKSAAAVVIGGISVSRLPIFTPYAVTIHGGKEKVHQGREDGAAAG
jgi:hypothetical protein